jgi:hypothetical protein
VARNPAAGHLFFNVRYTIGELYINGTRNKEDLQVQLHVLNNIAADSH